MSRYTITPWRTQSDLLEVRNHLYSTDETAPDSRRKAVNRVMAWKLRGNLPHAVESTALLVEATLHHSIKTNSTFSIRAVYSAAFARFVTGFCDIGRHKERSLEPSSMLEIARQIGMPAEFVALRHEATHEELPGMRRLVGAVREALDWLWRVYWGRLEGPEEEEGVQAALVVMRVEAAAVLRDFRRARLDGLRKMSPPSSGQSGDVPTAGIACMEMCKGSRSRVEALAAVIVEERLILPSNREIGSSMDGAYLIWDELLTDISSRLHRFLPSVVRSLLRSLVARNSVDPASDVDKEALAMWLCHVMSTAKFMSIKAVDRDALVAEVMKCCCLHPGYWTQGVGRKLLEISDKSVQDEWKELLEASAIASGGEPMEEVVLKVNQSEFGEPEKDPLGGEEEIRAVGGWSRAIAPISVPIGVVQ